MASDPGLSFVAMTMPSSGTFEERFDFTRAVESYTLNDRFSDLSDGQMGILATFPHANELLKVDRANHANDLGTVVRVLRGITPVAHFVMRRIDRKWSSNLNVKPALLDGAEFFLDRQTVPNFDYPAVPMRNPDWIYGAESVFEGPGGEVAFELQSIYKEETVTSGVFRLTFGGNETVDIAHNASASTIAGALEDLASIDQVTVDGNGTAFAPWTFEFIVPGGDVAQLVVSSSTLDGNLFVTTLRAGGTLDPRPWSMSFHPVTKLFHSSYTFFQMVEPPDPTYLDDTHSLAIDADTPPFPTDYGGAQVIVNVVGGGLYRAELPIYSPTSQLVRFIIRDMNEGHIASLEHTTAVATWEVLEIEGIQIPIGVDQVIFRIGLITSGDPGIIYISPKYALLAPGFKAATLGKILGDILVAIQAQGDFLWVTKTFTDTHDSKGVEWDQTLSWGVHHGQSLLQLHEYANRWNYRWGFEFNINTEAWNWQAYNPGTTLADIEGFAITGHDGVIGSGTISTKIPEATHYQADGEGGEWGEFTDTTMTGVWGRLHKYYSNVQGMASSDLAVLAERLVDHASEYTEGLMVELTNPNLLPWEHFKKGDSLTVDMEPEFPLGQMPVMSIVAHKEPKNDPVYNVHFNSLVFEGEAAIAENLRRLIRAFRAEQFNRITGTGEVDPAGLIGGGGGGMPTLVIAASNASTFSQDRADFICTGADDQLVWQQAIDLLLSSPLIGPGRIVLTEGLFVISGGIVCPLGLAIEGLGRGPNTTIIVTSQTFTEPIFEIGHGENQFSEFYVDIQHAGVHCWGVSTGTGHQDILIKHVGVNGHTGVFVAEGMEDVDGITFDTCEFNGGGLTSGGAIVIETCTHVNILNCKFFNGGVGVYQIRLGAGVVDENSPGHITITGNTIYGFVETGGISITKNIDTTPVIVVIANNRFSSMPKEWAIYCEDLRTATITGNVINGASGGIALVQNLGISPNQEAVLIGNNTIVGNGSAGLSVDQLILVDGYRGPSIIGNNLVDVFGNHGIHLIDCIDAQVIGNFLRMRANATTNVRDGIHLQSCTNPFVSSNVMRVSNTGARQFRDSIRIDAGTNGAVVVANDTRGSFGTNAINDLGTASILTFAGGAAAGDNF